MLELKKVTKIYETGGFKQKALDEVDICFRENEFTSVLGPSGSGKTTLLNIIGGLDQYTSGDLKINEISTKKYKDKEWDSYRNHRIGFVFQSYNLITHQSVLANVELALTLSGASKGERRRKAIKALKEVGLSLHINKKPNQLSGGQMQRVAIARALVNNPDILLADEPTGALDSETSKQIMNLLRKIAKDKLVIMVTHNSELASTYSTRIINLKDGKVIDDTNPYHGENNTTEEKEISLKKEKTKSMGLKTALSLSLNNLLTKKGRTFLTAFAGSIGIIGIALILSLSNGVNNYIERMEKETLSSYPIQIELSTMDYSSMFQSLTKGEKVDCDINKICTRDDISVSPTIQLETAKITNNLEEFKKYLDNNGGNIKDYVTDIQYKYNFDLHIYSKNTDNAVVRVNPDTLNLNPYAESSQEQMAQSGITVEFAGQSQNVFLELIGNSELLKNQYEILSGSLPNKYNEIVLIADKDNVIPLSLMYSLDIENRKEINDIYNNIKDGDKKPVNTLKYNYDDLIGKTYSLVLNTDFYVKEKGLWVDKSKNISFMKEKIQEGIELKIVGIVKVSDDAIEATSGYVGYTHELTTYVIDKINEKEITKEQRNNNTIDIFTGLKFDGLTNTYQNNLKNLGIASIDLPTNISIYPNGFEAKEEVENIIKEYNTSQEENNKSENMIFYTDYIGVLLSSVTTAVNVVTYILVAFVAVSLVVSSIMIAIITYISVLERTKEIGILRAIGASKKDISRVFRAETIIEGFIAGVFGVGVTFLLCFPINKIIFYFLSVNNIASLPLMGAIILIIISVVLTVGSGLIPARIASKKDPVEALRTD